MEEQKITINEFVVDKILKENANLKLENAKLEFMVIQLQQKVKELEQETQTETELKAE